MPRESRRALSRRNHFSSFLLAETGAGHEVRRSKSPRVAALCFRGNHFYSFLPGETGAREARRSSSPGALHFFCGNHFPSFLPADTSQPRQPVDWRRWGHHNFSRGNHFSSFLLFQDAFSRHLDFRQKFFL